MIQLHGWYGVIIRIRVMLPFILILGLVIPTFISIISFAFVHDPGRSGDSHGGRTVRSPRRRAIAG